MPVSTSRGPAAQDQSLLTVQEAAERLRLSVSILNKWRVAGKGPPFLKLGRRVLYSSADLAGWALDARRQSTSAS